MNTFTSLCHERQCCSLLHSSDAYRNWKEKWQQGWRVLERRMKQQRLVRLEQSGKLDYKSLMQFLFLLAHRPSTNLYLFLNTFFSTAFALLIKSVPTPPHPLDSLHSQWDIWKSINSTFHQPAARQYHQDESKRRWQPDKKEVLRESWNIRDGGKVKQKSWMKCYKTCWGVWWDRLSCRKSMWCQWKSLFFWTLFVI